MGESNKGKLLVVAFAERETATRIISVRKATAMKKKSEQLEDELRPEYDFSKMHIVRRGSGRKQPEEITVMLAPDAAKKFPTSETVNEALRLIIKVADEADKLQTTR